MKKIILNLLLVLAGSSAIAQNVQDQKVTFQYIQLPSTPLKGVTSYSIIVNTEKNEKNNQDSLDVYNSKLVLQDALVNFSGSLVIVSHDVDFLKPIVNKVLEIRKLKSTLFVGGIDYYLSKRNSIIEQEDSNEKVKENGNSITRKDQKRFDAENRKKKHAATKILKKEVTKLESEIESLELLIEDLEVALGDEKIYSNPQLSAEKNKEYENAKNKLEIVYSVWTVKSEELENIESEFN